MVTNNVHKEKIKSLQGLRVIAFFAVFFSHAIDTPSGAWGVSIFILLSGFLMTISYWNRFDEKKFSIIESIKFSIGKIKHLYPLHIIMLIAAFIPYYLMPLIKDYSTSELLKNVFKIIITVPLIQAWFPVGFEAINTVAWYLSAMLFLYAVFPFILRILKKKRDIYRIVLIMIFAYAIQFVFAYICRWIPLLNNAHWSNYILPLFRLGDFLVGCCLGYCFLNRNVQIKSLFKSTLFEVFFFLLSALGMIGLAKLPDCKWLTYTLIFVPSSAGIVLFLAKSEGLISKLLSLKIFQGVAVITPFAFLIHRQVLHYTEDLYKIATQKNINPVLLIIVAMIITVLLSYLYMSISKNFKRKHE